MMIVANNQSTERVVLAHGGGGELMQRLIRERILPPIQNETLLKLDDGARVPIDGQRLVMTTDSYVVTPLEFPGGDIGRIAVAGTVNDLAVMGATPVALSLGAILEEGLSLDVLTRIMASVGRTAAEAGVQIITGDTKVIERRRRNPGEGEGPLEGLFLNTTGIGVVPADRALGIERIEVGDAVLLNGRIAEHGLAVMALRSGLEFDSPLASDVAPLNGLIATLLESGVDVKFLRDATRGGVAGVLADIAEGRQLSVEIEDARVPLSPTARHAAEMLGLDPLTVANEGKVVIVVAAQDADRAVGVLRKHALGRHAALVGRVTAGAPPLVELCTQAGGRRVVQRPYGEDLPRIC